MDAVLDWCDFLAGPLDSNSEDRQHHWNGQPYEKTEDSEKGVDTDESGSGGRDSRARSTVGGEARDGLSLFLVMMDVLSGAPQPLP
jgi:hypothetical protein